MARPTKLTAEITDEIACALREGVYVETAAEAAGVASSTLYEWLDKGMAGIEPYAAFTETVVRARAEGEIALLRDVRAGDGKGESFGRGKAAAFLLERTRPNKYAQRVNLRVEDAVREVLEVVRGVCSPEDFARIVERLEGVDREGSAGVSSADPDGQGVTIN